MLFADLTDICLKGWLEATRFVEGVQYRIAAPVVNVQIAPRFDSSVDIPSSSAGPMRLSLNGGKDLPGTVSDRWICVGYIGSAVLEADDTALIHQGYCSAHISLSQA